MTHSDYTHMAGSGLFLLVVVFLMTYLILTFYNPKFVQRKVHGHSTCENDPAVTLIWAFVIALVILFLLGLLWYAFRSHC